MRLARLREISVASVSLPSLVAGLREVTEAAGSTSTVKVADLCRLTASEGGESEKAKREGKE